MKKTIKAIALITAICASLLTGCASYQSSADSTPTPPPPSTSVSTVSNAPPEAYNTVLELRSEGYQSLSLRDFNAAVRGKIDEDIGFLNTFSEFLSRLVVVDGEHQATNEPLTVDDGIYQFINETLNYSISEIILPQIDNPISLSKYLRNYSDEYIAGINNDETFYNFMFTAHYSIEYRVIDEMALTVQERDDILRAYQTELQNAISAMNKEQLTADGAKSELQKIADNLCGDLSTDALIFENAEIQSIEIHDGTQEYKQ